MIFIRILLILFFAFNINLLYADFPIGIYGVNNPEDIKTVKEAGFDTIQTYKSEPETLKLLADEAVKQNIKLVIPSSKIIRKEYQEEIENWPVLAWYIFDEPDVAKLSREKLNTLDVNTKNIFPRVKTVFVIGQGKTEIPYYDLADILMVDWYPVPHLPLESFGNQIRIAKDFLNEMNCSKKELWAVVQAFDWKEFKQYRPDNDRIGRFPTKEEIRFMSYDAVFNGATGLFYFIYTSKGVPLPQSKPDNWKDLSSVANEMAAVRNILQAKLSDNPIEIKEPLKAKTFLYNNEKYTFIINSANQPQTIPKKFFKKKNFQEVSFNGQEPSTKKGKNNLQQYGIVIFKQLNS
ncbi:hypothetical protein [Candidatus Ruminimicrobium bovinum]|uniref:hypothetical protein n=1 Tax=Candidatus Ruminimicrobium bovinum TaxID=3242779 RepID=UPI0039B92D3B